ncbi:MAG: hypothetical protein ABH848_02150 [Candidatus Omnitrophota bacterium]
MKTLNKLLKNNIIKQVLVFFDENPHSIDTAKGISVWIGFSPDEVEKALIRLAEEGILTDHKTASLNAYSYTNNKKIIKKIEKHLKNLEKLS